MDWLSVERDKKGKEKMIWSTRIISREQEVKAIRPLHPSSELHTRQTNDCLYIEDKKKLSK